MRITKIEIKNFRAFYGTLEIDLHKAGKNLLIYGENGSGKSSLYLALNLFLESSEDSSSRFENHQNIFIADDGHIKLHLRADSGSKEDIYEWSRTVKETEDQLIIDASKATGFLDYKALLETYFIHRESDTVDVFDLLVKSLLANVISNVTDQNIGEDWRSVLELLPSRRIAVKQIATLKGQLEVFNRELTDILEELKTKASEILHKFGYNESFLALDFNFQGIKYNRDSNTIEGDEIFLTVEFFDRNLPAHHRFLNEAKLSAIALAIYFAALRLQSDSDLKILAFDDVLIGLDMSNRLPVLDILEEYFSDYQIFLMTYDKAWYEIVKQRTSTGGQWKAVEFFFAQTDEYEIPVYMEDKAYLDKAKEHCDANDYKACAIYIRTAFETIIKEYCEDARLPVRYRSDPKKLDSQDFWHSIKTRNKDNGKLEKTLIHKIELCRSIILNPLSHATVVNIPRQELEDAMTAVEELQNELDA